MFHQAAVLLIGMMITFPADRPDCRAAAPLSTYSCNAPLVYRGAFAGPLSTHRWPGRRLCPRVGAQVPLRSRPAVADTSWSRAPHTLPTAGRRCTAAGVAATRNWTVSFDRGFGLPVAWKSLKNPRAIQDPASRSVARARVSSRRNMTNRNLEYTKFAFSAGRLAVGVGHSVVHASWL